MSLLVFVRYSGQQRCLAGSWVCKSGVGHFTPTLCGLAGTNWTGKDRACGESRPTSIGKGSKDGGEGHTGPAGDVEGPRCYWCCC